MNPHESSNRRKLKAAKNLLEVTYSDLLHLGDGVGPQLIDDGQQHLVAGDLAEVDPGERKQQNPQDEVKAACDGVTSL